MEMVALESQRAPAWGEDFCSAVLGAVQTNPGQEDAPCQALIQLPGKPIAGSSVGKKNFGIGNFLRISLWSDLLV